MQFTVSVDNKLIEQSLTDVDSTAYAHATCIRRMKCP